MGPGQDYAARRQKLLSKLDKQSAAIFFSSSEVLRNGDVHFPFRQNSSFHYFTGFPEPDAVAVFLPGRKEGEYILFNRAKDPLMERWLGPRIGQEDACKVYGADEAFDIAKLEEKIIELLAGRKLISYEFAKHQAWDLKINEWVSKLQHSHRKGGTAPQQLSNISIISDEMRLIKSSEEIALLKKAAEISASAHKLLMKKCKPDIFEYELEAKFDYEVKRQRCRFLAYSTIVGGGGNACILHYDQNKDLLKEGDLVLIDAGGEYENYAADITRTFPVNGKFTANQSAIYELVLGAQQAVIEAIRPGLIWSRLQEIAVEHLTKGLIDLKILSGDLKEALEKKSYIEYYMHNIGHWLGLDVHDVGSYKVDGEWRPLEEGMVLTVEPGLYLSPNDKLDRKWWNIGIRIEDDVLVTSNGCEVLTKSVPKTIKEIEGLMAETATATLR